MGKSLKELARLVDGTVLGDPSVEIDGISGIPTARAGQITFLTNGKYRQALSDTDASAVVISDQEPQELPLPAIRVENPDLAFSRIAREFTDSSRTHREPGIHDSAVISGSAQIGQDVHIGPHVTIGEDAVVGDQTTILPGTCLEAEVQVGKQCTLYSNVTLREGTRVGKKVIIHSSSVIGCDGFGYVQNKQGTRKKVPQTGVVVIEDDVEIGACVTIDRARFDETRIGQGVKIDNLVQIGHNVQIGDHAVIVSQVGVSGSVTIGEGSILAGQAGVGGHLTIGKGAKVAARAGVTKDVDPGMEVSGFPAEERSEYNRKLVFTRKLPSIARQVQDLADQVEELQNKLDDHEPETENNQGDH